MTFVSTDITVFTLPVEIGWCVKQCETGSIWLLGNKHVHYGKYRCDLVMPDGEPYLCFGYASHHEIKGEVTAYCSLDKEKRTFSNLDEAKEWLVSHVLMRHHLIL